MNMLAVDEHGNVEIVAQQSTNCEPPEMNFDFIESFEEKIFGIRKKDIPQGHELRMMFPHKFRN